MFAEVMIPEGKGITMGPLFLNFMKFRVLSKINVVIAGRHQQ
jgi:hypothetical protein